MAYASWSVVFGEQPSAAKWNILGTNDASFNDGTGIAGLYKNLLTVDSNPYKFHAYRTAAHTSSAAPGAVVPHDTELYDTNSNFDSVTNKGRYTAPVAGFYFFSARATNSAATSTLMLSSLWKNGTAQVYGNSFASTIVSGADQGSSVTAVLQLSASDYVEHYFIGGGGSTMSTGTTTTWFQGFLVCRT